MSETATTSGDLLRDGAITIDEAVAWSGIRRTRLYSAMADGRLPYVQSGRRRLIPRDALREFLADGLTVSERTAEQPR
jgi:excisionase family DNA binding protein